jgi:hypothetical protein
MALGCFTGVVLHSLKKTYLEHDTEPPWDIAATWGAVILRFHGVFNMYK